jgi:hypothetical protein
MTKDEFAYRLRILSAALVGCTLKVIRSISSEQYNHEYSEVLDDLAGAAHNTALFLTAGMVIFEDSDEIMDLIKGERTRLDALYEECRALCDKHSDAIVAHPSHRPLKMFTDWIDADKEVHLHSSIEVDEEEETKRGRTLN